MRTHELLIYIATIVGCGVSLVGALTSNKKILYAGVGFMVVASLVFIIASVMSS